MGGVGTEIAIVLLLLVANGVFAMSEIAVVAARKVRLAQRADAGDRRAQRALELANAPSQFLSTVQVGISLVGVLAGAYGGATIAHAIEPSIAAIPVLEPYAEALAAGHRRGGDHLPVADHRRARAQAHRARPTRRRLPAGWPRR